MQIGKEKKMANLEILRKNRNVVLTDQQDVAKRWKEYIEDLYYTDNRRATLNMEEEKDVDMDQKGFEILKEECNKAFSEMKIGKAAGVDDIPLELIKQLGEKGQNEMWKLCVEMFKAGEWPNDFLETFMISIELKRNARKSEESRTISLISYAAKKLLRMLNRRI